MAYISQRGAYWRAEIRRHGYKPVYRTFDTKQQAQQWIHRVESEMDAGLLIDRTEAENTIRLELQVVSHLFEIARKEWSMKALLTP